MASSGYNLVFVESEYTKAVNAMSGYCDFLLRSIESYTEIVTAVVEAGLQLPETDKALIARAGEMHQKAAYLDRLLTDLLKQWKNMASDLAEADDYTYEEDNLGETVKGFLSALTG